LEGAGFLTTGGCATNWFIGGTRNPHARPVGNGARPGTVAADEVAFEMVPTDPNVDEAHAGEVVTRDQIAISRRDPADRVVTAEKRHASEAVSTIDLARLIGAADDVAASADDQDTLIVKPVDDQTLDRGPSRSDGEAGLKSRIQAVELDGEKSVVPVGERVRSGPELRIAVDEHGVGDDGQRAA